MISPPARPTLTDAFQVDAGIDRAYGVRMADGLAGDGCDALAEAVGGRAALLVTTPTVARLYAATLHRRLLDAGARVELFSLRCGEADKSPEQVERICRQAQRVGLDRNGVLLAVGGGVCTDLVTVAASWIRRGIAHLRVPTTLLGQVDAGVGIKGAVNFGGKKSYLGCFHPPEQVLIDPALLRTLPRAHLRAGLAEVVKMAVVADAELFGRVETHARDLLASGFAHPAGEGRAIVWRSALGMLQALQPNLYENRTYLRLVDFGHTFSPALEAASGFRMAHGDAVAVDIALSAAIACELGMLPPAERDRIVSLLRAAELPAASPLLDAGLCARAVEEVRLHRGGALNLVVPTGIGTAAFVEQAAALPPRAVRSALAWVNRRTVRVAVPAGALCDCLVFDVGGTRLRAGRYHAADDAVTHVAERSTPSHCTLPGAGQEQILATLLDEMEALGREVMRGAPPRQVAVAFAGPVDAHGRVLAAPTVWGPRQAGAVDVRGALEARWPGAQVALLNDVSAAGYRYLRRGDEDLCAVTVGSGIGNKIFVRGVPFVGSGARGGEIGHLRVDPAPDANLCDCGGRGHLGAVGSGRGALLTARRLACRDPGAFAASRASRGCAGDPARLENPQLVAAFREGDGWAAEVVRRAAEPLGRTLASVHHALGIERFVVFGGFALALGEGYRRELVRAACESGWDAGQEWDAMIELGAADDLSGLVGAGRFATGVRGAAAAPSGATAPSATAPLPRSFPEPVPV
ncbi:MAG TPA: ROK family protein [Longimicrobium sp.]|nr:ROK family protein [Longimicrobium sp.]